MRLLVGVLICLRDILFGQEVLGDVKNRKLIYLCYTLNAPKKHHIVDISLNYVNFLLKQPLLHEIHDLLAFHYLKELIFQETTISLSKGAYFSRNHHIVDKSQYLIKDLIIGCICSCLVPIKLNNLQHYVTLNVKAILA